MIWSGLRFMTRITRSFRHISDAGSDSARHETVDVVGPICETGDFFARGRELPVVNEGDLLAILDAGAYGMVLTSNYNTRLRPPEVLVDGKSVKLIRRRETMDDVLRTEIQRAEVCRLCGVDTRFRAFDSGLGPLASTVEDISASRNSLQRRRTSSVRPTAPNSDSASFFRNPSS